ncbi:AMP-binding protein [Magnetospirillum sp. SS-4]|uniref:AMP-binding protein n=1 Tax=Magnetospirillum sp. SS-4 TaxID=2681465 RepID=UPI0013807A35|nr:AMP-binding protein [Magnetospirillum sp. SS-4]CAA7618040.1 putative AMP-dependent synthetase and ligase [Magnetospirillum sp. SS-4]
MIFGLDRRGNDHRPALLDAGTGACVDYAELSRRVAAEATRLRNLVGPGPALLMMHLTADVDAVACHLGALSAGMAVMPLPPGLEDGGAAALIGRYRPELVRRHAGVEGYEFRDGFWRRDGDVPPPLHPGLALLLSTSGSSGSPKCVRLGREAVEANARQIVAALGIGPSERAPTSLPLSYSYGLSVLHSHLAAGASVILTSDGVAARPFWQALAGHGATSLAGVPASYQMLCRLDLDSLAPPTLRTLTQAGGAMAPALTGHFHAFAARRGGRLFVMYGQTEAAARIAVLPPGDLPGRIGAAGRAVPGGTLSVDPATGHVVYRGPNVMMGYAEGRADLGRGDELGGVLDTGDLGRLDADGTLWITGRDLRIAKIGGLRLNLDEVEEWAQAFGHAAAMDGGDWLGLALAAASPPDRAVRQDFARRLGLHSTQVRWLAVAALPLLSSGKTDHRALKALPWDGRP